MERRVASHSNSEAQQLSSIGFYGVHSQLLRLLPCALTKLTVVHAREVAAIALIHRTECMLAFACNVCVSCLNVVAENACAR